jgi:hypothetical protein
MTRVLVDDFGGLLRVGVDEVLRAEQIEVVHSDGDLLARLLEELPDAVILNLDDAEAADLATRIATLFPAMTVVACSAINPTMRIYPPFHQGESYTSSLRGDSLAAAMTSGHRHGPMGPDD